MKHIKLYIIYSKLEDFYYTIKWSIINFFKYFKIVSQMRPWDYQYVLRMMEFQLKDLCNNLEKYGLEIEEDRLPKIEKMKRAIELLYNNIDDNYADRCGYKNDAVEIVFEDVKGTDDFKEVKMVKNPGFENYNEDEVFEKSRKLEEEEWNELFDILKNDMQRWWD